MRYPRHPEALSAARPKFAAVNEFTFLEKQSFDNFNEGVTLVELTEAYRTRFGAYPKAILADQIYRNRNLVMHKTCC